MKEYNLFAYRSGSIFLSRILISFTAIILLPILTKNISSEEYGVFVQYNVLIGLIPSLILLGLPFSIVRFLPSMKEREEISEGFYSIFFICCIISFLAVITTFLLSRSISDLFFNNNIVISYFFSINVFFSSVNNISINYFRAFMKIKNYVFISVLDAYLSLVLISLFIIKGYGILGAVAGILIESGIFFSMMLILITKDIRILIPKFNRIKEFLKFGIPTLPGNFSDWIIQSSDRLLIGLFLGAVYVGYYNPGYTLGNLFILITGPISFILPPLLSQYYDNHNFQEVEKIIFYTSKYFLVIAIPLFFGLSVLSERLLLLLTTPEIASNGYFITPFVILGLFSFGFYQISGQIIILQKKTTIIGITWVIAAVINFAGNLIFIPALGILGAALTTLFAYLLAGMITLYFSSKFIKIRVDYSVLFKSIVASLLFSIMLVLIPTTEYLDTLAIILVSIVMYFGLMFAMKAFTQNEIHFFRDLLNVQFF